MGAQPQQPCLFADVDECASGHSGCEHHCSNLAGSFQCFCEAGYRLDEDRRGCTREPPLRHHYRNLAGLPPCGPQVVLSPAVGVGPAGWSRK